MEEAGGWRFDRPPTTLASTVYYFISKLFKMKQGRPPIRFFLLELKLVHSERFERVFGGAEAEQLS